MEELSCQAEDPRRWFATNLIGLSANDLASVRFNREPVALFIAATRETHPGLFTLLEHAESLEEAAEVFQHYMRVAFGLAPPAGCALPKGEVRAHRSSYLKLLQGWGFEANSRQGAVLKGWVESRFGIVPTFHGERLDNFPSQAWLRYMEEKLGSRFHNNCIYLQLDVLYEYAQWSIARFRPFGPRHLTLYRGTHAAELEFRKGSLRAREGVVRLNNVVSCSLSRERAEEFGDYICELQAPCAKVVFYPGLLNDRTLNGEGEVLVLGGDFEVKVSYV
jgi:NAD+--dinitrogen-reductase ADP-D-ribosyltransferase